MVKKILYVTLAAGFILSAAVVLYSALREKPAVQTESQNSMTSKEKSGNETGLLDARLNLIYVPDEETGKIALLVLEVLNPKKGEQWYITIPAGTRYLMTQQLYAKISAAYPQQPQLVTLSELRDYYGDPDYLTCGLDIIGDMAGVRIEHYTVMPEPLFSTIFSLNGEKDNAWLEFSPETLEDVSREDTVKTFITEIYGELDTSWELADRLIYLELYDRMGESDTYFILAGGNEEGGAFSVDTQKLSDLLLDVCS